jgi:hypothetical protein
MGMESRNGRERGERKRLGGNFSHTSQRMKLIHRIEGFERFC